MQRLFAFCGFTIFVLRVSDLVALSSMERTLSQLCEIQVEWLS